MKSKRIVLYGKEKRRPYHGAKAIDKTCRNHGSCPYCYGSRIYKFEKKALSAWQKLVIYEKEGDDL